MSFWGDPIYFIIQWFHGVLEGWGLAPGWITFLSYLIGAFTLATIAMLLTLILIWAERKIVARVQDRFGPNRVGPWGIFQTIADMLKIFTKEYITPSGADVIPFNLAPVLSVAAVLMLWAVIPFSITFYGTNLTVSVLYIAAIGGIGELSVVMAGWGSNNKFALLAAFRVIAQLISYEVPMVLSMLIPVMFAGSMSLNDIVLGQNIWFIFLAPLAAFIFFISQVAEVGRAPFDLVEAESELVSGFNIEYSGLKFGMFYVADFLHAFTVSLLFTVLFLGGWRGPGAESIPVLGFLYFMLKTIMAYFVIVLMRASLPRFRIDQMMDLNWKMLTPLSLVLIILTSLLDKILPVDVPVIRVAGLVSMNVLLWFAYQYFLSKFRKSRPRRVVASQPRPVARYQPVSSHNENGA
jgi:NADH-quinone oxidoreductase subunit H